MADLESSIIIPVFNQWALTSTCLKALASTTKGRAVEVIVVDNASQDATATECPLLGKQLFGRFFQYYRAPENLNFGPATNLGAKMARGRFLVFLNNDTMPLPGWYQPLLDEFANWPNIAATSPVLLYPKQSPFGHTVQHLGVYVDPFLKLGHLYESLPATSPLLQKRRFFQIISAACMMIPKNVFLEAGMFDAHFINGYEDIDLCARLSQRGLRMTVNPAAQIIHHTSQTSGRYASEGHNFFYFCEHTRPKLQPDLLQHITADGMELHVSPWLTLQITPSSISPTHAEQSEHQKTFEQSVADIEDNPYSTQVWEGCIALCEEATTKLSLLQCKFKILPSPHTALDIVKLLFQLNRKNEMIQWLGTILNFCKTQDEYIDHAHSMISLCTHVGNNDLRQELNKCIAQYAHNENLIFKPFFSEISNFLVKEKILLDPLPKVLTQYMANNQ